MGLLDVAVTEGAQTQLDHRAVVQDLCWEIRVVDGLLWGGKDWVMYCSATYIKSEDKNSPSKDI